MKEEKFISKYKCSGTLKTDTLELKNIRAEIIYSNINPSINKARVYILRYHKYRNDKLSNAKSISFESRSRHNGIKFTARFNSIEDIYADESQINLDIIELEIKYRYQKNKPNNYTFTFFITKSLLFNNRKSPTIHGLRGYYKGWNSVTDKWEDTDMYEYTIGKTTFKAYQGFLYSEQSLETNGNNSHILIDQHIVECTIKDNKNQLSDIKNNVIKELEKFLFILSFIEGVKIEWYYLTLWSKKKDNFVSELQFYKTVSEKVILRKNYNRHATRYLWDTFNLMLHNYQTAEHAIKNKFDKLLNMYLIAFSIQPIEARIIFAITCLDLIKNYSSKLCNDKDDFVNRLIKSCKLYEIKWTDLYPDVEIKIENDRKKTIDLYRIRKELVHEGLFNPDINLVLIELKKTRCLTERFILKLLEVDWVNSGLGKFVN